MKNLHLEATRTAMDSLSKKDKKALMSLLKKKPEKPTYEVAPLTSENKKDLIKEINLKYNFENN